MDGHNDPIPLAHWLKLPTRLFHKLIPLACSTKDHYYILFVSSRHKRWAPIHLFLAFETDGMLPLLLVSRDVCRSSQTGESTGDRPAFLCFGSSSGYNCCNPNRFSIEFELQFLKVNRIPDHQSYIINRVNLNVDRVGFL